MAVSADTKIVASMQTQTWRMGEGIDPNWSRPVPSIVREYAAASIRPNITSRALAVSHGGVWAPRGDVPVGTDTYIADILGLCAGTISRCSFTEGRRRVQSRPPPPHPTPTTRAQPTGFLRPDGHVYGADEPTGWRYFKFDFSVFPPEYYRRNGDCAGRYDASVSVFAQKRKPIGFEHSQFSDRRDP